MELTSKQADLYMFVQECHGEQVRKYTGEPYFTHPYAVAEIVNSYNVNMGIEISLCHDLFEDTECKYETLFSFTEYIGYSYSESYVICEGVNDLTDIYTKDAYPKLNRRQRKVKECFRLSRVNQDIQTIKYADLLDNTRSIVEYDKDFAKVYLYEKRDLLRFMRDGNIDLYMLLCYNLYDSYLQLGKCE